jgi:methionyl aminopeptidase
MQDIKIHSEEDFEGMRRAGRLAAEVLDFITPYVVEGISTLELNDRCHDFIIKNGAYPAPLNYRGFPKSICTSIGHVICHGIPDKDKILKPGDIINLDITVILNGWHGDTSRMFILEPAGIKARKLCQTTYDAMMAGINAVKPGITLGDIGYAIQQIGHKNRYSIVHEFCGHGIGKVFHDAPAILHYGNPGEGIKLEKGMFFTIEPMLNEKRPEAKILQDGWTAVTRDRGLSAQFEHSIGVTDTGVEIFTLSPKGWHQPPYF